MLYYTNFHPQYQDLDVFEVVGLDAAADAAADGGTWSVIGPAGPVEDCWTR